MFEPVFQIRGFGRSLALNEAILCALLKALVSINVAIMRETTVPHPYRAGLHYQREPICRYCEEWRDCLEVLEQHGGDCEDLAAYYVAWYRVRGIPVRPFIKTPRVTGDVLLYHIQAQLPDGRIVDPSRVLGMGKEVNFRGLSASSAASVRAGRGRRDHS